MGLFAERIPGQQPLGSVARVVRVVGHEAALGDEREGVLEGVRQALALDGEALEAEALGEVAVVERDGVLGPARRVAQGGLEPGDVEVDRGAWLEADDLLRRSSGSGRAESPPRRTTSGRARAPGGATPRCPSRCRPARSRPRPPRGCGPLASGRGPPSAPGRPRAARRISRPVDRQLDPPEQLDLERLDRRGPGTRRTARPVAVAPAGRRHGDRSSHRSPPVF